MSYKAGIVGLPNVGKSTLFNAITHSQVEAANYPFATIKPNTGVVAVPDDRLDRLSELYHPERTIYATFEFYDIAGLVRGASKGEGLGNQFLANIRECEAIVHLVRCFHDKEVVHVETTVDPLRDIEIINLELILADLESIQKRIGKVETKARVNKDKEALYEFNLLTILKEHLERSIPARQIDLSPTDQAYVLNRFFLLTMKPMIYVANLSEDEVAHPESSEEYQKVAALAKQEKAMVVPISCEMEYQLSSLSREDKADYLAAIGVEKSGLDQLIRSAYTLLNLATYFTVGSDECRAWTFLLGSTAPECAGVIHTDFQRGFIKAEVCRYEDLLEYRSEAALKELGKLRIEGKEYLVKDGDVMHFRFNV